MLSTAHTRSPAGKIIGPVTFHGGDKEDVFLEIGGVIVDALDTSMGTNRLDSHAA